MRLANDWIDAAITRTYLPARLLMSLLFLMSGIGKLTAVGPTQAYMAAYGVPVVLIWPTAAFEIASGALLVVGIGLRPLAVFLAGWCLLTAAIFHTDWSDQIQQVMFLKNMTMAGGFLILARMSSWKLSGVSVPVPHGQPSR
jgi:putative oxidoreductase